MVNSQTVRNIALSLEGTVELPHFEKTSFRLKKKIYATMDEKMQVVTIKLNEIDQSIFVAIDKVMIYRVPNKWGLKGWTIIDLKKVNMELLEEALGKAWQTLKGA
ncbi:MmcQ/YjbR family DNA-binding protein [Flavihumibacter sp. ZG627]|uniref:MmcQ/YjbR family DNA-binding protein n=1 Tax=Flavihumibacter sp. ZG627 TaxID=1463156 RepID=UPI00057DBBF2|nr:MmcQ/YjbR family DNA-binding protein [Flavihumibacter sp. ZG627]KIC90389.1 hypothetical protein HY58_10520 [Flavihumibacter sp. ZG627]